MNKLISYYMGLKGFPSPACPHLSRLPLYFYSLPSPDTNPWLQPHWPLLLRRATTFSPAPDQQPPPPVHWNHLYLRELLLIFQDTSQLSPALCSLPCHIQAIGCTSSVLHTLSPHLPDESESNKRKCQALCLSTFNYFN